jgi:hypothetical protein
MILWLLSCSLAPYPDYWPDRSAYPIISRLDPAVVEGRAGGVTLTIEGRQLSGATTVVVGGRNAEIVSVDDRAIMIRLPELPAGPEELALSVVTGKGASTEEAALKVQSPGSDFFADETVSVSMARLDCPIEAWGVYADGEEYPYAWCGSDMGYASADAWIGIGPQPGFAAETSAILPLAALPPVGEFRVFGPGERLPPAVPLIHGAHGDRESVDLTTVRNFRNDYQLVLERRLLIEETYSWADSITDWRGPIATLMDDEQCFLDEVIVTEVWEQEIGIDGDATGASRMTLGFAFEEDYGDWVYTDTARVSSAEIVGDGAMISGETGGVRLGFDMGSGWFLPDGFVGPGDVGPGEYTISISDAAGLAVQEGFVLGSTPLDLWDTVPQLMTGYTPIDLDAELVVSWDPAPPSKNPSVVAVEIAVYDMSVLNPNGLTLVARLLAQAEDQDGRLVLPADAMARLPVAPNLWNEQDEASGYWGDMTIARHSLRKVPRSGSVGGDVVVDFVHAINGPVFLERAEPETP